MQAKKRGLLPYLRPLSGEHAACPPNFLVSGQFYYSPERGLDTLKKGKTGFVF